MIIGYCLKLIKWCGIGESKFNYVLNDICGFVNSWRVVWDMVRWGPLSGRDGRMVWSILVDQTIFLTASYDPHCSCSSDIIQASGWVFTRAFHLFLLLSSPLKIRRLHSMPLHVWLLDRVGKKGYLAPLHKQVMIKEIESSCCGSLCERKRDTEWASNEHTMLNRNLLG